MRKILGCAIFAIMILLALPRTAFAQTGLTIYGGLDNFDCYNESGQDCDGFEIEIEGLHKEDVWHTWAYSAFGAPTVTTGGTLSAPTALIRYYSDTLIVSNGGVTHFGANLNAFVDPSKLHRRWLVKAQGAPPVPVILLSHTSKLVIIGTKTYVRDVITNDSPDNGTIYFILPFRNVVHREVTLEELVPNDPLITGSTPLGDGANGLTPVQLDPTDSWYDDDGDGESTTESVSYSYELYRDVVTYPNGIETHSPGKMIGKIMDATLASASTPAAPSFTVSSASTYGGTKVTGTVTMNAIAAGTGAIVTLHSDNPNVIVPKTLIIVANSSSGTFTITTKAVSASVTANITATIVGAPGQATLVVNPPDVLSLKPAAASITGGLPTTATVNITSPAPTGGILVQLSSDSISAVPASSVTIPAGKTSAKFAILTSDVAAKTVVNILAVVNGITKSGSITLTPNTLKAMVLSPTSVKGGGSTTGTITLLAPAHPGGVTVSLLSSLTSVATVPSSVVVSEGSLTASFSISTSAVLTIKKPIIKASINGVVKSVALTVNP